MRRTLGNLTSVVGGEFLLRSANFVAAVLIARLYGATTLGIYTTALAFATLVSTVGDNGLNTSSLAEASRRPHDVDLIVSSAYATKTLLFSVVALVAALLAWAWHVGSIELVIGSLVMGKVLLNSYGQLHLGILKALDRMRVIGVIQLLHACALLGGTAVAYRHHWDVRAFLSVLLACQIVENLLSGAVLRYDRVRFARTSVGECLHFIKISTPVGLSSIFANFILRLDVLVVSLFYSPLLVGHFAAANNGVVAMYAVASLFGSVLLPEMVKLGGRVEEYIHKWIRIVCAACVPIVIAVALCATRLVVLVYGRSFADAGPLVGVMVLAIPLIIVNAIYFNRAIALQMRRTYLSIYFGTGLLAVALDVVFARHVGLMGVAIAIVIREAAMLAAFAVSARSTSAVVAVSEPAALRL
jgi:O-antigen/teichoic acid export membrane protein